MSSVINAFRREIWFAVVAFLVVFALTGAFGSLTVYAKSTTPDTDDNNVNNDFAHAQHLGKLDFHKSVGNPVLLETAGELGNVLGGFDSVDIFSFDVLEAFTEISALSKESPPLTSWVTVFDSQERELKYSRGNSNEQLSLALGPGRYYIAVRTEKATAGTRLLNYSLSINGRRLALPDIGGKDCIGAQPLGSLSSSEINGSISSEKQLSYYSFFVKRGGRVSANLAQVGTLGHLDIAFFSRIAFTQLPRIEPFDNAKPPTVKQGYLILDPGYYCLAVHYANCSPKLGCVTPPSPVENYTLKIRTEPSGPSGGRSYDDAYQLTLYDLGRLVTNGQYKSAIRYPYLDPQYEGKRPSSNLIGNYRLREWLDNDVNEMFIFFDITETKRYAFHISALIEPIRTVIESSDRSPIAELKPSGFVLDGRPTDMHGVVSLKPGRYYLHLFRNSAFHFGTSVTIDVDPAALQ